MGSDSNFARPQGHDGGPAFFDGLSKLFVAVAVVWTVALCGGIAYLFIHRRQPCVRIRNLPLAVSAVASLHVYWVLCMVAYPMNGAYPCNVEYWVMSIYLPIGIALFQANNMQLLSVACLQEQMLSSSEDSAPKVKPPARTVRRYWLHFNGMSLLKRTETAIGTGMFIQLIISLAVFLASRKFSSFGRIGEPVSPEDCRRGPEWIPSILWQLTWAWFFAPFILWKIRHINDVHQWRLQTTVCIIAGLPGSPMWLAALYSDSPHWAAINKYWVPPLWFAPGIMAMQAATILAPVVKLKQTLRAQKYVAKALREWEDRKRRTDKASLSGSTAAASSQGALSVSTRASGRSSGAHSKDALERYLAGGDVHGLLDFAVHREFSGENITFLVFVRQWRAAWRALVDADPGYDWERDPRRQKRHLFKVAVEIFADLVEVDTARFPINIEAPILVSLRRIFGEAARLLDRPLSATVATPFLNPSEWKEAGGPLGDSTIELVERDIKGPAATSVAASAPGTPGTPSTPAHTWPQEMYLSSQKHVMSRPTRLPDSVHVPRDFASAVFDRAHDSVMHMVLHNTWPRFVDDCAKNAGAGFHGDVEAGMSKRLRLKARRASTFF